MCACVGGVACVVPFVSFKSVLFGVASFFYILLFLLRFFSSFASLLCRLTPFSLHTHNTTVRYLFQYQAIQIHFEYLLISVSEFSVLAADSLETEWNRSYVSHSICSHCDFVNFLSFTWYFYQITPNVNATHAQRFETNNQKPPFDIKMLRRIASENECWCRDEKEREKEKR